MPRIEVIRGGTAPDDSTLLQNALDSAEALGGGEVFVPDGTYVLTESLLIGDNVHLHLDNGCTLIRGFMGGAAVNATIRNATQAVGPNPSNFNIRVSGGTIKTESGTFTGKHLGFVGVQYLRVDGVRFLGVKGDWNTIFTDCQDVTIDNVVMNSDASTSNEDGLHFAGGARIVVTNCVIVSGDDCLSLTNEEATEQETPLVDVAVSNCYFYSLTANAVRIQVEEIEEDELPPIHRVSLSNIVAKCGNDEAGGGIRILGVSTNHELLTDIVIDGLWLDSFNSPGDPLQLRYAQRVRLQHVVFMQPNTPALVDGCENVDLIECVSDRPHNMSAQSCLWVASLANVEELRIIGGVYRATTLHGIHLGSANFLVAKFQVANVYIQGNTANASNKGLYVQTAAAGLVSNNYIFDNGSYGIDEANTSLGNVYLGNYLLTNATAPLRVLGLGSQAIRNTTATGVAIDDTGGFRQTIDGWIKDGGLTALTDAEIPRNNFVVAGGAGAGRFRAVRAGSVTGVVITSDSARTAGTLKATVFKNATGTAGGAGSTTGLFAQLDGTNTLRHAAQQAMDVDTFLAGDELYVVLTTSTNPPDPATWAPTTAKIHCAIEIED